MGGGSVGRHCKCHWEDTESHKMLPFLLTYKWPNGRACLKKLAQLPDPTDEIFDRRPPLNMEEDLSKLTMGALKDRLREKNLKISRAKQELIDRLTTYYRSISDGCE